MNLSSSTVCQGCKADVSEAIAKGASSCPSCGWWLRLSQPASEPKKPHWPRKRFLFFVFLCFFLGTPVNIWLFGTYLGWDGNMINLILGVGCYGAGFTLAKMVAKKRWVFWVLGFAFSQLVGGLYAVAFIALIAYGFAYGGGC